MVQSLRDFVARAGPQYLSPRSGRIIRNQDWRMLYRFRPDVYEGTASFGTIREA